MPKNLYLPEIPKCATVSYYYPEAEQNLTPEEQRISELAKASYQTEYEAEAAQGPQYGPGRKNFKDFYRRMRNKLGGKPTCKISGFSDYFDENKDYAGMIVYAINNKFSWTNEGGLAEGYNGRAFYVVIQCTNDWPDDVLRDVGNGRVHHYLIENTLGYDHEQKIVCCGGFSYHDGELKFSSVWLNGNDQKGCKTDGSKYLNEAEEKLVRYCFKKYKQKGPNSTFGIPDWLDSELWWGCQ